MRYIISFLAAAIVISTSAEATVTKYTNKINWENAAGAFTTITFTELPVNTLVTNQYADYGVVFTTPPGSFDFIYAQSNYPDGLGLQGNDPPGFFGTITMEFSSPMYSIAVEYLGLMRIKLYSDGQLLHTSTVFDDSIGPFGGLISTDPFDKAEVVNAVGPVMNIDNLYFGPPIPAPGALGLFAVSALAFPRRRRRCGAR